MRLLTLVGNSIYCRYILLTDRMHKVLSLKLAPHIYEESEEIIMRLAVPRNRYINDALQFYNSWNKRKLMQTKLHKESRHSGHESLAMLEEFESLEDVIRE